MNMSVEEFKISVLRAGNTGALVELPDNIDDITAGNIMAEVAGFFIDRKEDIKGIIILNERKRLGV